MCQDCGEPASVHSQVQNGAETLLVHLCRACAEKRKILVHPPQLPMLLPSAGTAAVVPADLGKLVCPECGITFMDFRKQGRLGCPRDYDLFHKGLVPLLDRVHRAHHHVGKRPRRLAEPARGTLLRLRAELRAAIAAENYEAAARLRDQIRQGEARDGS